MSSCRSTIILLSPSESRNLSWSLPSSKGFLVGSHPCIIMQVKAKLRRWGNSYGVVLPKDVMEKEGLKEGDEVDMSVRRASVIRRLFGRYPFKDLQFEKNEMRKGWK